MKYRDPSIRACRGTPAPLTVKRPASVKPEPRVFRVAGPKLPHPPVKVHDPVVDRSDFLPGGLPPEPYRTPWKRVGLTGKVAREPFNSREIKGEFWATKRYLEG